MFRPDRRTVLAALALLGSVSAGLRGAAAEAGPAAVVDRLYGVLLEVMKSGPELKFQGRYERLKPALDAAFDLPLMTRISIGPQWASIPAEQQQRLTRAFSEYTYATYASRFDDYGGEKFEVTPQASDVTGGTLVQTKLVKGDGEAVQLNYLLRGENGGWRVIDVFLNGTVSELATRRSEFTSVLRRDGAEGLVRLLDDRVAKMRNG